MPEKVAELAKVLQTSRTEYEVFNLNSVSKFKITKKCFHSIH
jgi:hypothetical protein